MTLGQVIGQNVRLLRGSHTLEELATHGRAVGATWSSGSISAIERGDFKTTVETVALLALALDRLRGAEFLRGNITSRDLLQTDQPIALGKTLATSTEELLRFLGGGYSGEVINTTYHLTQAREGIGEQVAKLESLNLPNDSFDLFRRVEEAGPETPATERLAKKIGADPYELRSWSVHLWGKTFEDHRDQIAGPDSTPQKKGRVSRELLEEIQTAMKEQRGND